MQISIPDGARVAYAGGINRDGLDIGDVGNVLQSRNGACHVIMRTGKREGAGVLVPVEELTVLATPRHGMDDSLSFGTLDDEPRLVNTAMRQVYDTQGASGLMTALASTGNLPEFSQAAEEAFNHVVAQVRNHPTIRQVLSDLDEEEGEGFVQALAATALDEALEV